MAPILAAAVDAVIIVDESGRVLDLNPAAERLFGYPRARALGQPVAQLVVPAKLRAAYGAGLRRVVAGGNSRSLGRRAEVPALHSNGHEFPVEVTVTRTDESPPRFAAWVRALPGASSPDGELAVGGQRAPRRPTARELEVLELAADGHTDPGIGNELGLSVHTIKTHLEHAYAKLGVGNRTAAVARALRTGLIR